MNWSIAWHQALTKPMFQGLFKSTRETAGFRIPVRVDGTALRLRLLHRNGNGPVNIYGLCAIYGGKLYPLTVGGERSFSIALDETAHTDPVELTLKPDTELELRIFCDKNASDFNNIEEGAVIYRGNATDRIDCKPKPPAWFVKLFNTNPGIPYIDMVEIQTETKQKNIVAFGDSITAMNRWVKPLAERLYQAYGPEYALLNSGISGNCLTYHPPGKIREAFGDKGTDRFERDVLEIPNLHAVIMAFGINDIDYMTEETASEVNEEKLRSETERLTKLFQSKGIRVIGQTLGPRKGFGKGESAFSDEQEAIRKRYNEWVRSCGIFDYVVDIEPYVLEPGTTDTYKTGLHQGDFLHPSIEGGRVIADVYDLKQLVGEQI